MGFRNACADLISWKRADLPTIRMAVNISPHQLGNQQNINRINSILAELELDSQGLDIDLE